MTTFDEILPKIGAILKRRARGLSGLKNPLVVNRDLKGRVCLVASEKDRNKNILEPLSVELARVLAPHAFPPDRMILFERDISTFVREAQAVPQWDDLPQVLLVDRLAMEGDWGRVEHPETRALRVVFYSVKGGVGRTTALAAAAWHLANLGHRVLVVDLDLESPGLSTSLLPDGPARPMYGLADWLVEDLVDNGEAVISHMVARSDISESGDVLVVPAHGQEPGEYLAKLGRIWMPKVSGHGHREPCYRRLGRALAHIEEQWAADVVLLDSRAGIDELASACLTRLGARLLLLFAVDSQQTWSSYRLLFSHWRGSGSVGAIRERLQIVGALMPVGKGAGEYAESLRDAAYTLFSEEVYDEAPAGLPSSELWSFDLNDEQAPHFPWRVSWNQGFFSVPSVYEQLRGADEVQVRPVFSDLFVRLQDILEEEAP